MFSAYREEELPLNEKNSLAQHLESCASCKREYEEFVHTLDLIHSLPHLEAPADFTDQVLARVQTGAPVHVDPWWQRVVWSVTDWADSLTLKPAYAAAAAVLVVAVATFGVIQIVDQDESGVVEQPVVAEKSEPAGEPEAAEDEESATAPVEKKEAPVPDEEGGAATQVATRDEPREAPAEGKVVTPQLTTETRGERQYAVDSDLYPVVPDSLFDHEYDFEFALDRFYFEMLPDDSGAGQMYPLPATKGRPASITF
jgi:hypothetical protein